MNNEKELFVNEEEIILMPPTELFDEAQEIAQTTVNEKKFPFMLQYDVNQKDFLMFMLGMINAIVETDDKENYTISTQMNMTQLAFIKRLDCVERVKTDEGNSYSIIDDTINSSQALQNQQEDESFENKEMGVDKNIIDETLEEPAELAINCMEDTDLEPMAIEEENPTDNVAAVASVAASARCLDNCCPCPTNGSMATAITIPDEGYRSGYIGCPGAEQWFKFVATRSGQYTICTVGKVVINGKLSELDTIGALYDCHGNLIVEVDDYAPCGKINFRIIQNLTEGHTYYIKVAISKGGVGSYSLRVTQKVLADYVTINKDTITLIKGVTYELPSTPDYIYKEYNGAQPIPGLSVSINPSNTTDQNICWWAQFCNVLDCYSDWDEDGNKYFHVTATETGTATLYAQDDNENGKKDECSVTVVTSYENLLQNSWGFTSEETNLIQKVYDKVDAIFATESELQRAWRCARLLSEFCYDDPKTSDGTDIQIINPWDNTAGSVTTNENREMYFINTLGFTQGEYNLLKNALLNNKENADNDNNIIDFTHMQYALAARLAYTLRLDKELSNWGPILYTLNVERYSDEDVSYLGGWLGDAVLAGMFKQGIPTMGNDDYLADLDAENIYRLIIDGCSSTEAAETYYLDMNSTNNRASTFLQYISYDTVKNKIFYELIDAELYMLQSQAIERGDFYTSSYYTELINDEQYHYDVLKLKYPDTYNFLKSLENCSPNMKQYI